MKNKLIINNFKLLLDNYIFIYLNSEYETKQIYYYKIRAIKKIIKIIENIKEKIINSNMLINMSWIGKKTLLRIDEILKTGKLWELQDVNIKSIKKLMLIDGIGYIKANELIKKNILWIWDLIKYKTKLNLNQQILLWLKYYNKLNTNIKYLTAKQINYYLKQKRNNNMFIKMCGWYRRKKKILKDIDVIVVTNNPNLFKNFILELKNDGFIIDDITTNFNIMYKGYINFKNNIYRIDIICVKFENYYTALLYFTGSFEFNINMRQIAKKNNYLLNRYGLYFQNKKIKINSEKDIFNVLKVKYIMPLYR